MIRIILICFTCMMSIMTLLLIVLMISRWNMDYNEQGVYFDKERGTTFNSQALIVIQPAAVISLLLLIMLILWLRKRGIKKPL